MKFPIYRPRGLAPPDVTDDIKKIWEKQIKLNDPRPYSLSNASFKKNENLRLFSGVDRNDPNEFDSSIRYKKNNEKRSSIVGNFTVASDTTSVKLKYKAQRKRFNEDTESII